MARKYKNIQKHELEIIEMWNNGAKLKEIAETLGFTYDEIRNFKKRYNKKQKQLSAGKVVVKRGKHCKNSELPPSIQRLDKLTQMRYVIASKDRYIKQLEMENELMRDFLSVTERM